MSNTDACPRQEDMELAAKLAIAADDNREQGNSDINAAGNTTTIYQEKLDRANRRQQIKSQQEEVKAEDGKDGSEKIKEEPPAFYEDELDIANRQQQKIREQQRHATQEEAKDQEEQDCVEPPSVIAILEEEQPALYDVDDLDSISQSIPFVLGKLVEQRNTMSAEEMEQRFQQLTDILMNLQKQQFDSFTQQHEGRNAITTDSSLSSGNNRGHSGAMPSFTSQSTEESRDSFKTAGLDPPAMLSRELNSTGGVAAAASAPLSARQTAPDPPAMQVLIGDALQKLDPNGQVQTNDLDNWVQERLSAPASVARRKPLARRKAQPPASSSELDDRKLPARRSDNLFALEAPTEIPNFGERWQRVEQRVRSELSEVSDTTEAASSKPSELETDTSRAPSQSVSYEELKRNTSKQLGAIRVAPANPIRKEGGSDIAIVVPDNDDEDGKPTAQEPDYVDDATPITAHVVVNEDRDSELKRLNDAVAFLQEKQNIIEATVQRAEPVDEPFDENGNGDDDEPSYLEVHGHVILFSCLALGVGIVIGLRMRHPGGNR